MDETMDPEIAAEFQTILKREVLSDPTHAQQKKDLLDALQVHKHSLAHVALQEGLVDPTQARKDTRREDLVLNGVYFSAQAKVIFAAMSAVAMSARVSKEEASAITERIFCSTSRTATGADSYFALADLFMKDNGEDSNILLKPRPGDLPPVKVDMVSRAKNNITCTVSTVNLYGLYCNDIIEEYTVNARNGEQAVKPWMLLDTLVTEELVFNTKSKPWFHVVRTLQITTPESMSVLRHEAELDDTFG